MTEKKEKEQYMRYYGTVYRPPSEAYSLIVQVTLGCSHNTCAFCSMYKEKNFVIRPLGDVLQDFAECRQHYRYVERIFLADGDALICRMDYLRRILRYIKTNFPECRRITCYASPISLLLKSEEDLRTLKEEGLDMVYMGLESGCDEVLTRMRKGHSAAEIIEAGQKARRCGLALSVTAISGLGGTELIREHALGTARALSAMNPEYIGVLTLLIERGTPLEEWVREGSFVVPQLGQILEETAILVENIDSPGSVFRMNHASNYLDLRGTFNEDREDMLETVRRAMDSGRGIRPEYYREL